MLDELKDLEIKRLFKEYDYLLVEDEYKKTFIEKHRPEFLKEINKYREKIDKPIKKEPQKKKDNKKKVIEVNRETKRKIKKVYRKIVKITHPDKTNSKKLHEIHSKAKDYYEENNLLGLYLICIDLNIKVDFNEIKVEELKESINEKRKKLEGLESSYLWLWVHSNTEEEKEKIINLFIEQNS